jgi:hypothetical protein
MDWQQQKQRKRADGASTLLRRRSNLAIRQGESWNELFKQPAEEW